MTRFFVEHSKAPPMAERPVEIVERKGVGHPDTMCDAVAEEVSLALSRAYLDAAGRVLHHNVDKALLIAGASTPAFSGGHLDAPMRLIISGRATTEVAGRTLDVAGIAEEAARRWLEENLRFVEVGRDLVLEPLLRPGSAELTGIFDRDGHMCANDTSAAVGFSPLSPTEQLVIIAERLLNSSEIKSRFPEVGEDVKVMALRFGRRVDVTLAVAFVSRFIESAEHYFARKEMLRAEMEARLRASTSELDEVHVHLNTLDDPALGAGGMYLTVTGTSAENADEGQVGRGNRVCGVIPLMRPIGTEAAAGKNPVSHVGKVYNFFTHHLAARLTDAVPEVEEARVAMVSQIGAPLAEPWGVEVTLLGSAVDTREGLEAEVRDVVKHELSHIDDFVAALVRGERSVW